MMSSEGENDGGLFIAGVLVRCQPQAMAAVTAQLKQEPGVEVHTTTEQGAIVTTLEADGPREVGDGITRMSLMDGVLAATPVYNHFEPESDSEPAGISVPAEEATLAGDDG